MQINDTMIYVYRLPAKLADGFAFGGGNPVTFQNVDWFNGVEGMDREMLETHIQGKVYVKPGQTFLVMSPENDLTFTFTKPEQTK